MERDLKIFVLRALLAAKGEPMQDGTLRQNACNAFMHVAITVSDLRAWIHDLETAGLIAGTHDEVTGIMWALTPKGRIRAQALV